MTLTLSDILPNTAASLDGSAFFFGAGTSFEAGYPMMAELTKGVVSALTTEERGQVDSVLSASGQVFDDLTSMPNIEVLVDRIMAYNLTTGSHTLDELERRLKALIISHITAVVDPNIEHHCKFFTALKRRAFGLPCKVWIITTNYDMLFEIAAARCGVILENGFSGVSERFFYPEAFVSTSGHVQGQSFTRHNKLVVNLLKLHGSVSWVQEGSTHVEKHPQSITSDEIRAMILPRRLKVMDTLAAPYDTFFSQAARILGTQCRYAVSCGFSFSDEHINAHVLSTPMKTGKLRLFALCAHEPDGLSEFKNLPNFHSRYDNHGYNGGKATSGGSDAWRFSKFVSLFE